MKEEKYTDNAWCKEYLGAGEYLKWSGKSKSSGGFRFIGLILAVPLVVITLLFVSSDVSGVIKEVAAGEESVITLLIMLPGALLWFGIISSIVAAGFIVPEILRRKTLYAVTSIKVIQKLGNRVKIINLDPPPQVGCKRKRIRHREGRRIRIPRQKRSVRLSSVVKS